MRICTWGWRRCWYSLHYCIDSQIDSHWVILILLGHIFEGGGGEMSSVWVDHRLKRSEQGGGCRGAEPLYIGNFLEFALKILVFDGKIQILSKYIKFLNFLRKNFIVWFSTCISLIINNLQVTFFFRKKISFFGIMYTGCP